MFNYEIEDRVKQVAEYIIDTKSTVRKAAKVFGVSKSTVHVDMTKRLEKVNPNLAYEIKNILEENKLERHIRGGQATKEKYMLKSNIST